VVVIRVLYRPLGVDVGAPGVGIWRGLGARREDSTVARQAAGAGGPRVVIVDVHASDSFREFASALRQRGVDVVHLRPPYTGRGSGAKRRIDALAGPVVPLPVPLEGDDPSAVALRRRYLSAPTVDVHATEPVLAALSQTDEWLANPALVKVRPGLSLAQVVDKWEASRIASAAGIAVPDATTDLVATEFPVVVKGRLGVGGMFVRIAADQAEVQQAVEEFRAQGVEPFLEKHHPHVNGLGTGGVCKHGRMLTCGAFERLHAPDQPLQPSIAIRAYHDQAAEKATEQIMAELGYTGIFCLNFVPDDDGAPLLIDINLRAFGSWVSLELLGVPILDAYLEMLGVGPKAPPTRMDGHRWLTVVHAGSAAEGSLRSVWDNAADMGRASWAQRPLLGWGWAASTGIRLLETSARGGVQAAKVRRAARRGR
jgi:hypothetical protein